jgi:hypothetical protein
MRKIHINGKEWSFKVGKRFAAIKSPDNKRFDVKLEDIKKLPQATIDAARGNRCDACVGPCDYVENYMRDGMIRPSDIKNYILENLVS